MIKNKWFVADFETTTEEFYNINGYTKVWLYAISNQNGNVINYGYNIEDFFQYIENLENGSVIYFHNLKFDGSYILNYLLTNNFEHIEDKINNNTPNSKFSTLIDDMGVYYSITCKLNNGVIIKFFDSLKLIPFKVEKIAIDFGLPVLKGKIDYNNYVINEETLNYVFNDTIIIALALKEIKELGMEKMTTASCAYNEYSSGYKYMNLDFPEFDRDKLIEYRQAYRGGRCQVNPIHQNVILNNVKRFDINSMYPYIMHDLPLPYGKPLNIEKMGLYKFEVYHLKIGFVLKNGHLPSLLKKGSLYNGDDTYYIESEDIEDIYISNIDYELLEKHYNIYYLEFIEGYGFKTSKNLFKSYIDKWYEIKNNSKGAKKYVAKMMLNSLYGKFGSNPRGKKKIPKLEEHLCYEFSEEEDMPLYYLWVAIAVTSHAHKLIDDNIYKTGVENFVYCDTDSIHTLGSLPNEIIDNKELGKFKLEGIEIKSKYIRQKCYVVKEENNSIVLTCAGMPQNVKEKAIKLYNDDIFDVFKVGFKCDGKLLPKQVKGGVILRNTTFEIK